MPPPRPRIRFNSQMLEESKNALKNQNVHEREIASNTFCIRSSELKKAQKMTRAFQDKLQRELGGREADEV